MTLVRKILWSGSASRAATLILLMAGFLFGCATAQVRPAVVADGEIIRFSVEAPNAERVVLVLMNAKTVNAATLRVSAEKRHRGIWSAKLSLPPGHYRYFFMVDGSVTVGMGKGRVEKDDFGGVTGVLTVRGAMNGDIQVY